MDLSPGNVIEDNGPLGQRPFLRSIADHTIDDRATGVARSMAKIEPMSGGEPRIQGHRHETALAEVEHLGHDCDRLRVHAAALAHPLSPRSLADEHPAVWSQ